MSGQEGRGGRGTRGRGRPTIGDQPRGGAYGQQRGTGRPQTQPGMPQPPQGGQAPFQPRPTAPAPSAWGHMAHTRGPAPQPQQTSAGGRATSVRTGPGGDSHSAVTVGEGNGNGNDGSSMRRGTVRGKRQLHEGIVRTRPASCVTKLGSFGKPVKLSANYFKVLQKPNWCLYQYRVDFAPDEDRIMVKKALLRRAVRDVLAGFIFDGTVLYTTTKLDTDPVELFVQDEVKNENVRITIRLVGDVAQSDMHYLQLFNILMRKCLGHLQLQLVGRNFFDAAAKVQIVEYKLELWPGYVTSIRQHESSVLLCCEITHKVMRYETVLDLLEECRREDRQRFKEQFNSKIIGTVVLTEYNNRTYRIDDVDYSATPRSTFNKKDGSTIAYGEYFRSKYQLNIRNPDQPMLVSRAKAREIRAGMQETVYLVPELCRLTGLTDNQRSNFQLMRALADHTRVDPKKRIDKLIQFSRRLTSQPDVMNDLREWDLKFATNLVEFSGRELPPETVNGNRCSYSAGHDADWTKELRSRPMATIGKIESWIVVCPSRNKASALSFVKTLLKAASGMSFNIPMPQLQELQDDRPRSYISGIDAAMEKQPRMIMCIVTNNKADRYASIKQKTCVDKAVLSQVMVLRNLESKGVMSIATKVAIQINAKLGGVPWTVPLPIKGLMVVGYDVCHDTSNKNKSFGAMVAAMNSECGNYFSTASAHNSGEELSNDFSLSIIKAMKAYKDKNGAVPEKILIYRDGVGEGQITQVKDHEVAAIVSQLSKFYESPDQVKMAFIVVSKRINTRIFNQAQNPKPGTVVDTEITLPERYDFFLVSQCVRQGTVSPTSYNVIYDTLGLDADKLQRVTYKLTHMYFNWSGTVRVPAPCQYAHKLAFLCGQHLHRNPHTDLENYLYYL